MKKMVRKIVRRARGFTLVEMLAVTSIIAVTSAIVFPAVTGTTTSSRGPSQAATIVSVQEASDRWNNDFRDFPTKASLAGATTAFVAGALPAVAPTGTGASLGTPKFFNQSSIAGINFSDTDTLSGVTKTFNVDYLRSSPAHAADTITLAGGATSTTFSILKGPSTFFVALVNQDAVTARTFDAWGLDTTGEVWVFVDKDKF